MIVALCDDQENRIRDAVEAIESAGVPGIEVLPLAGQAFRDELKQVFARVTRCLSAPEKYEANTDLQLDKADIAIIDNNLSELSFEGARLTAESVAGYVRAFTSCPYVVSLNKNHDVDFDLRYLIGDYETRADVAINSDHLSNLSLWTGRPADASQGFFPWYWPHLLSVTEKRERQIEFVAGRLSESVLKTLGFRTDEEFLASMTRQAQGALAYDAVAAETQSLSGLPLEDVTFYDHFRERSRSLALVEEREIILKSAKAGNASLAHVVARAVAADIDFWMRRDMVGPQQSLVDLPHLVMRMPFVLGDKVEEPEAWNATTIATKPPFGLDEEIFETHLKGSIFSATEWTPAPVFDWPSLKSNETLNDLFLEMSVSKWPDIVFCEDTSSFVATSEHPVEFVAQFEGGWARRYVRQLRDFSYAPLSRLAI